MLQIQTKVNSPIILLLCKWLFQLIILSIYPLDCCMFNRICHTFRTSDIFFSFSLYFQPLNGCNQPITVFVCILNAFFFLVVVVSKRRFVYRFCTFIRICLLQSPMLQKHYWLHFVNMNVHEINIPVFHFSSMYIFSFSKAKQNQQKQI